MGRLTGPDEADRLVYRPDGRANAQGYTAEYWAAETGPERADIRTLAGSAIPGSTLPVDMYSRSQRFQYPPGDVGVVWCSTTDGKTAGPRVPMRADRDQTQAVLSGTANVRALRLPSDVDDTAAVLRAVATGAKRIYFPAGTYTVAVPTGTSLGAWTGVDGVFIDAGEATIVNTTQYAYNGAFTAIWLFSGCRNVRVEVGHYIGRPLDVLSELGYRGELFVRLINGCDGVIVRGAVSNVRYAVQSGQYDDPSKGYCRNIRVELRTVKAGYPLALYLADTVRFDIDADASHRAAYLAGCVDVSGVARWQDQYGPSDVMVLITDATTGPGTSRGPRHIDVASYDKGSAVMEPSTFCAALGLSRVDPGTRFEDIRVRVYTRSTDTISPTVGGFRIASAVTPLGLPGYTDHNWDPSIVLRNITVSGTVDKSAQAVPGNLAGNGFSVRGYDYINPSSGRCPTIENVTFEDFVVREPGGGDPTSYFMAPLLGGAGVTFRRVDAPGTVLYLETNTAAVATISDSKLKRLYQATSAAGGTGARAQVIDSAIAEYLNGLGASNSVDVLNGALQGAASPIRQRQLLWNLAGATTTLAGLLPGNAVVLGVQGRLTQPITGATGMQVGVSGALTRYADVSATAAGTVFTPAGSTETGPRLYPADTNLLITAKGSAFTGGQIRVVVHYIAFDAPTA